MKEQNKKTLRLKRAKIQQLIISISCLLLLVFIFGWMINLTINSNNINVDDGSSKALHAAVKADKSKDETNSRSKNDSKKDKEDSRKDKESSKKDNSETSSNNKEEKSSKGNNDDKDSKVDNNSSTNSDSSEPVTDDDFEDAAFIGDSRTVGLQMNSDKPKASFYASIGLNVDSALTDKAVTLDNGQQGTVLQAMSQRKFGRIYIMFGINELGWPYPDIFEKKYEDLIKEIKKLQPDAKIYIQSILPVSYLAANINAVFTNDNVNKFNKFVRQAADNTESIYLDVGSIFKDANGALPAQASTDGIHLIREYCQVWINYLAQHS